MAQRDPQAPDIRFRPHHFLCALGYEGKGYSDSFTANMSRIVIDQLRGPEGGAVEIKVVAITDDICAPCPKRRGELCGEQDKIQALDTRHASALGIAAGDQLTWAEAQGRIVETVRPGDLATLCMGCQWLELGLCEAALSRLHSAGSK